MKCAIIIPALNPEEGLVSYIDELLALDIGPIILINDGSEPETAPIFQKAAARENCFLLTHQKNQGKGRALKTGIRYYKKFFSALLGIITVDADGQHRIEDVQKLYRRINENPNTLILGSRDFGATTPTRSRIGNTLISFSMNFLYNVRLKDTQTGLRAIPSSMLDWVADLPGERYDFELNMLIVAQKKAVPIVTETIETVYYNNNKGSHYRTFSDSARIIYHLSRAFIQYVLSSALSAIVDITTFILLSQIFFSSFPLVERLLYATIGARMVSSIVNYSVNRHLIYAQSSRLYPTALKYYILWFFQLISSFSLLWLISAKGPNEIITKISVDLCLALISYQVQLRWVFREKKVKKTLTHIAK